MQTYLDHPTEEALERFLLNQSQAAELEIVETHILACESCVDKLETLEMQIAATKTALNELERFPLREKSICPSQSSSQRPWRSWFTVPALSWAGAVAAVALCVAAFLPAQVNLAAYRGTERSFAPEWRPLDLHLNASDLADGRVAVQLVNGEGVQIWTGTTSVHQENTEVHLPRLTHTGTYFVRLYEPADRGAHGDLLREYPFQVK